MSKRKSDLEVAPYPKKPLDQGPPNIGSTDSTNTDNIIAEVEKLTMDAALIESDIFKTLKISLNLSVTIQVTSIMDKVLSDVLQALQQGKCKLVLLVGPARVGKTTTLLWLYKKLAKLNICVLPVTHSNKENVDVSSFHVFLMGLHDLMA